MKTKEAAPAKGPSRKALRLRRQSQPLEEADARDALAYTAVVLRSKFNPPFRLAEAARTWQRVAAEALQLSQEYSKIPTPDLGPNIPLTSPTASPATPDTPADRSQAEAFWLMMTHAARSPEAPRVVIPPWDEIGEGVLDVVRGAIEDSVKPALTPFVLMPQAPSGAIKPEMTSILEQLVSQTQCFIEAIREHDRTRETRGKIPDARRRPPSLQHWTVASLAFNLRRAQECWTDTEIASLLNALSPSNRFDRNSVRDIRRSLRVGDHGRDERFEFPWRVNRAALFGTRPGVRPLRRTPMPESTPPVDRGKPPQSE